MSILAFIICLFALQLTCLYAGRKSFSDQNDQDDYFLAGRTLKFFPLMMTCIATQVGGGLVLGATEEAYHYGWTVLLYPMGACIGLIILGLGVGKKLAELNVSTSAQIFETIYRSPTLKRIASALSVLTLFMILIGQFIASEKFMASLGVTSKWLFVGFWAIVIVYTTLGGFKAVVTTDIVQVQFFVFAFLLCGAWIFFQLSGSENWSMLSSEPSGATFEWDMSKMFGWLLMPLLFMLIEQDMAQRCFSGESSTTVSKAFFWSGICTFLIALFPIAIGVLAHRSDFQYIEGKSVFIEMVTTSTNQYIAAIVGCAILAATISTADSLINAISSNLSLDFDIFTAKKVKNSRIVTIVISSLALFLSFFYDNVVNVLIISYELSVSCLFVATVFAIFRKKGHWIPASLSIAFGAAAFIGFHLFSDLFYKPIAILFVSLTGFGIGELLIYARKDLRETVSAEFEGA